MELQKIVSPISPQKVEPTLSRVPVTHFLDGPPKGCINMCFLMSLIETCFTEELELSQLSSGC